MATNEFATKQAEETRQQQPVVQNMMDKLREARISRTETSTDEMRRNAMQQLFSAFYNTCFDKAFAEGNSKVLAGTEMQRFFGQRTAQS